MEVVSLWNLENSAALLADLILTIGTEIDFTPRQADAEQRSAAHNRIDPTTANRR